MEFEQIFIPRRITEELHYRFPRFCEECVNNSWKSSKRNPTCPICRMSVDGEKEMDFDMVTVMSAKSTNCRKCNKFVRIFEIE